MLQHWWESLGCKENGGRKGIVMGNRTKGDSRKNSEAMRASTEKNRTESSSDPQVQAPSFEDLANEVGAAAETRTGTHGSLEEE